MKTVRPIPFSLAVLWLCGILDIPILVIAPHIGIPILTLMLGYALGRQVSWWRWRRTGRLP